MVIDIQRSEKKEEGRKGNNKIKKKREPWRIDYDTNSFITSYLEMGTH